MKNSFKNSSGRLWADAAAREKYIGTTIGGHLRTINSATAYRFHFVSTGSMLLKLDEQCPKDGELFVLFRDKKGTLVGKIDSALFAGAHRLTLRSAITRAVCRYTLGLLVFDMDTLLSASFGKSVQDCVATLAEDMPSYGELWSIFSGVSESQPIMILVPQ